MNLQPLINQIINNLNINSKTSLLITIQQLRLAMLGFQGTNLISFGTIQQIALIDIQTSHLHNFLNSKINYQILHYQVTIK